MRTLSLPSLTYLETLLVFEIDLPCVVLCGAFDFPEEAVAFQRGLETRLWPEAACTPDKVAIYELRE